MIITTEDRPVAYPFIAGSSIQRTEPITLEFVKAFLRFPSTTEDIMLGMAITAARTYFEEQTGRQCIDAIWEYSLDGVPVDGFLELPRPPLKSIVSVSYDDASGVPQDLDEASYVVRPSFVVPDGGSPADPTSIDPYCTCGHLELASGGGWPTTSGGGRSLRVRRVCGYGPSADYMPPMLQMTLAMMTQYFHERQSGPLPVGLQALINGFKWTALQTVPPQTFAPSAAISTLD